MGTEICRTVYTGLTIFKLLELGTGRTYLPLGMMGFAANLKCTTASEKYLRFAEF